jgi:hypothetical protein
MNIFERLDRLDLKIYEVSKEHFAVDGDVNYH